MRPPADFHHWLSMYLPSSITRDAWPHWLPCLGSIFALGLICFAGCSSAPVADEVQGDSFEQLSAIHQCYMEFYTSKKKPPQSKDDLAPLLTKNGHDPVSVFKSKRDDSEFVIVWDVKPTSNDPMPVVFGYESTASDEQRMVLTTMGVMTMSESEFQSASFPPDHTPVTNNSE